MSELFLCTKCVNPSTRPNSTFDEYGVCGACLLSNLNNSNSIDWKKRDQELLEIVKWGQANASSSYDCIVTVSGGKDSMRQAFFVRDDLDLNPLLVSCVYPPEHLHERGARNLSNLIEHGFDCISVSLNPIVHKQLMRLCLQRYSNLFNASEMALYAIPIHAAIAYQVPLVFLGDNPALTVGEGHGTSTDGDASQTRHSHTLMGGNSDIFLDAGFSKNDLYFYNYPSVSDFSAAKIRLVYLGYYIKDWSAENNGTFAVKHGLEIRNENPKDIGDLDGFAGLDEDFRLVNQYIKFLKFGFGYVTDQVMDRIHAGKITRDQGLELIDKFDGKLNRKYIERLCKYLNISENEFDEMAERSRDKNIWEKDRRGEWKVVRKSS